MKSTHGRSARGLPRRSISIERKKASASRRACLMLRFFEESLRSEKQPHARAQFDGKEVFRRKPAATNTPPRKGALRKMYGSAAGKSIIPGHALHEESLQRQIGVGTLISSQQQSELPVPLIIRRSTAGFVPLPIYIPRHAWHEKGLQRQIGVGTLVSSQERRALAVPLINRGIGG